jgi:hypothetical protein
VLIVALLVAGLTCLCIGLLLSSAVWLAASLAASALAGIAIYRWRAAFTVSATAREHPAKQAPPGKHGGTAEPDGPEPEPVPHRPDPDVWVVDGRPRYHCASCPIIDDQEVETIPLSQAGVDGFIPCSLCQPERVDSTTWV